MFFIHPSPESRKDKKTIALTKINAMEKRRVVMKPKLMRNL